MRTTDFWLDDEGQPCILHVVDDPLRRTADGLMYELEPVHPGEVEVVVDRGVLARRRAAWRDLYFAAARVALWPMGSIRSHRSEHMDDFQELRRALDALDDAEVGESPSVTV